MAVTSTSSTFSKGILKEIYGPAYKMAFEAGVTRHLCKPLGVGQKGNMAKFEYFDPTTFSTCATSRTETTDITDTNALSNASVIVYASEFGIRTDLTDALRESSSFDFKSEAARQHGIAVGYSLEKHILNILSTGLTTGTVTGTNSTNGFTIAHYMAAKSKLDAKTLSVPGRKHAVVGPYAWYYTAKASFSSTYAAALPTIGETVLKKFYATTLLGDIDVYLANQITAATTQTGYMFVTDAVGLWIPRDLRLESERNASARADELVSTMRAGAKVLIAGYGVRLRGYGQTPTGA